jgi:hypothetical protein
LKQLRLKPWQRPDGNPFQQFLFFQQARALARDFAGGADLLRFRVG